MVLAAAEMGQDSELRSRARRFAKQYLDAPAEADPRRAEIWLPVAAVAGDRSLWERTVAVLKGGPAAGSALSAAHRARPFPRSQFGARQPSALEQWHARGGGVVPASHHLARPAPGCYWRWMTEQYSLLVKKLGAFRRAPAHDGLQLLRLSRARGGGSLLRRPTPPGSGHQPLAGQSLEDVDLCIGLRKRVAAAWAEHLAHRR